MRLLSDAVIDRIMPIDDAVQSAVDAFCAMSSGTAIIPLRNEIHRTDPKGGALIMPGLIGNEILGVKLVGHVFTPAAPSGKATTCMMLIWDAATMRPRGLIASDQFNDHRTAAGFAAATQALARSNSRVHTVIGAGKLSFATVLYIAKVRPIERVNLLSRTAARIETLAARIRADDRLRGIEVVTGLPEEEAITQADIISAVTTSETPVFDGRNVKAGTHINLGGANRRTQREMDDAAAARAKFWLDSNESCRARAGDVMIPLETGVISEAQIRGQIGDLFLGRIPGRRSDEEITVFKSMGVAAQDLTLGAKLLDIAERENLGQFFDIAAG